MTFSPLYAERSSLPETSQISSAGRRHGCTVGLDLRVSGQAGAVAVDGKGEVCAWALVFGDSGHEELSKLAIRELSVRPIGLRVLIESEDAQVGVFAGVDVPETDQIVETMLAEGYEPIDSPAVASMLTATGTWLVAQCDEDKLNLLAERFSNLLGVEPQFLIHQLFLAKTLDIGSAAVERDAGGLSIVAMPPAAAPLMRWLPAAAGAGEDAREALRTLDIAGVEGSVWVLGSEIEALVRNMGQSGFEVVTETMPIRGLDTMPARLELAWRLAADREVAGLRGPRLDRRRRSVQWAHRTAWTAIALGLLGFAMFAYGLTSWLGARERLRVIEAETAGMDARMQQLRETIVLSEEVQKLRNERAEQTLPWPRLAPALVGLARQRPPNIGWERLTITEGALELEVSASGPSPDHDLALMGQAFERFPAIVNLAWEAHEDGGQAADTRRTYRAKLREITPSREEAMP